MQSALNIFLSTLPSNHPLAIFLRFLVAEVSTASAKGSVGFDVAFGLGTLGTVTLAGPVANFSGVRDYEELTVQAGAVLTPTQGRVTIVRARKRITWNGQYAGQNVFPPGMSLEGLVPLGGPSQSGGGGGGGGGDAVGTDGDNGQSSQQTYGGGAVGYTAPVFGSFGQGGAHGAPGSGGTAGTIGTPGTPSSYFQDTALGLFPGINAAMNAVFPGPDGASGGRGGNGALGAQGGAGGAGGTGGASAGLVMLIAPEIVFGNTNSFQMNGLAGAAGGNGAAGAAAAGGSNGGGGGGGGGGSGGSGGNGGILLMFYGTKTGNEVVSQNGGAGGAGGFGGAGGALDGTGRNGGGGGIGSGGPGGAAGFTYEKQIIIP